MQLTRMPLMVVFPSPNSPHVTANLHKPACRKYNSRPTKMHSWSPVPLEGGKGHIGLTMQDELYSACYGHHFIIPCDPWPYLDVQVGTTAVCQAELKAQHKNLEKAHDTALAIQMLLQNHLIDMIPNYYLAELCDPDKGYNQHTFCDIIFYIFDQFALITQTMVDDNKALWTSTNSLLSTSQSKNNANHLLPMWKSPSAPKQWSTLGWNIHQHVQCCIQAMEETSHCLKNLELL